MRVEVDLVVDADAGNDHAELAGYLAADHRDALRQCATGAAVDERHQAEADTELERIDRQFLEHSVAGDNVAGGRRRCCGLRLVARFGHERWRQSVLADAASDREESQPDQQERDLG